jgi:NAD(P)-dependent dehydrogenase (short-subunit alcohol dehydrogenase family)
VNADMLAGTEIRVNCITPGAVHTAIFGQMTKEHINFMLSNDSARPIREPRRCRRWSSRVSSGQYFLHFGQVALTEKRVADFA